MFNESIICCYLYPITKYGYPPPAENTTTYLQEMKALGFQSVELEGIRKEHILAVYEQRSEIKNASDKLELQVPYYCVVLPELSSHDKKVRQRNLQFFEKGCETAKILSAKGVLDNGPLPPYQFPENIPVTRHYDEHVLQAASIPSNLNWKKYWTELI